MKYAHLSNDILIDRTRHVWQPRVGRELTREDARQIAENAIGFFSVLAEWSRAEKLASVTATDCPASNLVEEVRHER